ncbi:MAG: hypothetical protein KDN05_02260 [Verrucomicrobiae bacterium]|nr:hypothetical protein [Verrucomicrobiae bacterium]MCP5548351.1 hypothetical protein [Akkermansiaceae bacterium]
MRSTNSSNGTREVAPSQRDESRQHRTGGNKNGGAEPTAPPADGTLVDKTESATVHEHTGHTGEVAHQPRDVPNDLAAPASLIPEVTAEDIMAAHTEQAPSEENGFSLEEVVATEQVVPTNMAQAAGAGFRKPSDKEFIRVTRDPEAIKPFEILEVDDKTKYIVTPTAMSAIDKLHEVEGKVMIKTKRVIIYLAVNMDGVGFLWPITVTESDNTWLESAHNCAAIAQNQWIRVVSNGPAKRYDYHPAKKHAEVKPKWPKETFIEMLNLAFKNKVIKSLDHPAIKELLDEA